MSIAYYNGEFAPIEEIKIPLYDRALFFGDGIYEAILARNGKMYLPDMHIERFYKNAGLLGINFDMKKSELYELLCQAVALSQEKSAFVYFQLTKFARMRRHACPPTEKYNLLITVTAQEAPSPKKRLKLLTYPDLRYFYCNIKTLNLLPAVIASEYAERHGADEAVLCRSETVTECAHSNISILKDGILYTHPKCELILPGIAREMLLQKCKAIGVPYREEPFTVDTMYTADSILVTSSTKICLLAESIDAIKPKRDKQGLGELLCESLYIDFINETK